jgi:dienelactone hydrolase
MRLLFALVLLAACPSPDDIVSGGPEPLNLPDDPAADGVPIGVRTIEHDGNTLEVWYPASDHTSGETPELDVASYVPQVFTDAVDPFELPTLPMRAMRDVAVRPSVEPYPAIVFSHGLGGFREQSVDECQHLASRGYVVVAVDHPGRMLGDLLPCLLSPPLDGCIFPTVVDPGVAGVRAALHWLENSSDFLNEHVDIERLGMTGHSAGGGTTLNMMDIEDRFLAFAPQAVDRAVIDEERPTMFLAGSCDFAAESVDVAETAATMPDAFTVELLGAGHMAFTDLCTLGLQQFADDILWPRPDVSSATLQGLLDLANSGCPAPAPPPTVDGEGCEADWMPLAESEPILRHALTTFFDLHLKGQGSRMADGVFAGARITD